MHIEIFEKWEKGTRVALLSLEEQGEEKRLEILSNFKIPKTDDVQEYLREHGFSCKYRMLVPV